MSKGPQSSQDLLQIIKKTSAKRGFLLNKDEAFVKDLVDGLYANLKRYGYASCPCRLSAKNYEADKDILCPCIYMKNDVDKYGMCFCCLYVSQDVFNGISKYHSIPESRPLEKTFRAAKKQKAAGVVWKCSVCGHEHTGENPPDKCPVCGSGKEFFRKSE